MIISSYTAEKWSPEPKQYAISKKIWQTLRPGDFVISRSGHRRICLQGTHDGFVVLQKVSRHGYPGPTTTYVTCDRGMFNGYVRKK